MEDAETAKLYISMPGAGKNHVPTQVLRGFDKKTVQPDRSAIYIFHVTSRDLGKWDVVAQKWKLARGRYKWRPDLQAATCL